MSLQNRRKALLELGAGRIVHEESSYLVAHLVVGVVVTLTLLGMLAWPAIYGSNLASASVLKSEQ
jgi:hypothetical protein